MSEEGWRQRLQDALTASGKSDRAISLAARTSPGYLHSILKEGKEPTLARLLRIVDALGVSLSQIAYGIEMTADEEELLRTYAKLTAKQRDALLEMAKSSVLTPTET